MSEKTKKGEAEADKPSATRLATKGVLGGLQFGFILYLATLFFRVAINTISPTPVVPVGTELGGFAIGFSGGIVKNL